MSTTAHPTQLACPAWCQYNGKPEYHPFDILTRDNSRELRTHSLRIGSVPVARNAQGVLSTVSVDVIADEERSLDGSARVLQPPMIALDGSYAELTVVQAILLACLLN